MEYDFIVGFTLFNKTGFKTIFRHFDNLRVAKRFASNVNIKDNHKLYVDFKYFEDKIKDILEDIKYASDTASPDLINVEQKLKSLLEKEDKE